jgi:hypothetical protein
MMKKSKKSSAKEFRDWIAQCISCKEQATITDFELLWDDDDIDDGRRHTPSGFALTQQCKNCGKCWQETYSREGITVLFAATAV